MDAHPRPPDESPFATAAFRIAERALLIVIALLTLGAAAGEMWAVYQARDILLTNILLMFLYTEVLGMVAVF